MGWRRLLVGVELSKPRQSKNLTIQIHLRIYIFQVKTNECIFQQIVIEKTVRALP